MSCCAKGVKGWGAEERVGTQRQGLVQMLRPGKHPKPFRQWSRSWPCCCCRYIHCKIVTGLLLLLLLRQCKIDAVLRHGCVYLRACPSSSSRRWASAALHSILGPRPSVPRPNPPHTTLDRAASASVIEFRCLRHAIRSRLVHYGGGKNWICCLDEASAAGLNVADVQESQQYRRFGTEAGLR